MTGPMTGTKTAVLHRMVMDKHICPYGIKSKYLLEREGFTVDDRWLTTREQTDAFKVEHGVKTTPQTFIDGARIGGNDDLRRHLGKSVKDADAVSYVPVLAIFAMAALMAGAISWMMTGSVLTIRTAEMFIAVAMCLLAVPKLQDVEAFATMFLGYDLLARRWLPYAYIYPFAEGLAGVLMLAHAFDWIAIPTALFIGTIGAVSVFYAVYIQKRDIKCACVGGSSRVPLGFVSLTENVMMVAMAVWMIMSPAM
ncbi:MauE/DoxX family redox-associated membrane protein [Blastomonas sp.]|uniref:MauE/DoxX family redox-associated membrane protein n=1 Tax=Blastomonas sp. TaxID=1909299 RepID=UPI003593A89A